MSADLGLGKIITTPQKRDAIHVAVVPVVASTTLKPGTRVGIQRDPDGRYFTNDHKRSIGVVDPFLLAPVKDGEEFWLFLYPGSITSLRHDWTHPELP